MHFSCYLLQLVQYILLFFLNKREAFILVLLLITLNLLHYVRKRPNHSSFFVLYHLIPLITNITRRLNPVPSTMSSRINTVLILGASRGIGEALAHRFHSLGKKVIVTARKHEEEKLIQLTRKLPGLEYRVVGLPDVHQLRAAMLIIFTVGLN